MTVCASESRRRSGIKIQRDEVVRAVTEANVAAAQADPDAAERIKAQLGLTPT